MNDTHTADKRPHLISALLDVQKNFNYLPEQELDRLAAELRVPITRLYAIATFYAAFSLQPKGRHIIRVCLGTACHVRGGQRILDRLHEMLDLNVNGNTSDGTFSVETVNCLGACALGPLLVVDGRYHTKMTTYKIQKLLKSYQKENAGNQRQGNNEDYIHH